MSDYLWDKTGLPDPEIEKLEHLLAPLRLQSEYPPPAASGRVLWGAAAACLLLGVLAWKMFSGVQGQRTGWVEADGGRPVLAGERVRPRTAQPLALESDGFGRIELQPGSEVRVLDVSPGRQRMQLRQGRIHVLIWAPPGQFVVDTPSARAIDLGCQYDLSTNPRGDGFLRVQTGWVAFETEGNESFIPAGAACRTTKAHGPGIPYFEDARQEFRSALERFENDGSPDALAIVLAGARTKDGVTLWHLLRRLDTLKRAAVFDRFAELVPLPSAVVREKALALDTATLDLCWGALNLAEAQWWREWKRNWK